MSDAGMSQAELLRMQQRITEQMVYASQAVAPYNAAVVGTPARHLSGATRRGAAFILFGYVQAFTVHYENLPVTQGLGG